MKTLSSSQIQVVIGSLYLATEEYSKLAMKCLSDGNERLYEQFLKQEKDCKALISELE